MKNSWYKAEIIKRFMGEKEQKEFDRKYQENKVVNIGKNAVHTGNWKPEWKKYI